MLEENRAGSRDRALWLSCFLCTECPVATVELLPFKTPFKWSPPWNHHGSLSNLIMASLDFPIGCPNLSVGLRTSALSYSLLHFPNRCPPSRKAPWIYRRGELTLPPRETAWCASLRVANPRVEREKRKGADILEPLRGSKEQPSKQMAEWNIRTVCMGVSSRRDTGSLFSKKPKKASCRKLAFW